MCFWARKSGVFVVFLDYTEVNVILEYALSAVLILLVGGIAGGVALTIRDGFLSIKNFFKSNHS